MPLIPEYLEAGGRLFQVVRTPPPVLGGKQLACCIRYASQRIEISDQVPLDDARDVLRRASQRIRAVSRRVAGQHRAGN